MGSGSKCAKPGRWRPIHSTIDWSYHLGCRTDFDEWWCFFQSGLCCYNHTTPIWHIYFLNLPPLKGKCRESTIGWRHSWVLSQINTTRNSPFVCENGLRPQPINGELLVCYPLQNFTSPNSQFCLAEIQNFSRPKLLFRSYDSINGQWYRPGQFQRDEIQNFTSPIIFNFSACLLIGSIRINFDCSSISARWN